ncbi:MAG: iron-sulfur cluster assembly accessory protein [Elusimicrobia bacterium]|nr:iron-sulfur cluster assembly accessory protein [Elusimicrobiota bacterium]
MVTLTENATKKVKEIFAGDPGLTGKSLRVLVEKGGCSSYQYGFSFDEKKDGDAEVDQVGFKVLVDSETAGLVAGSVIDYKEDFSGGGFAIANPNAKSSCGCGKSFNA